MSANAEQPMPLFIRVNDCRKWFSVSRDTIYRAAKKGEIKIHKAGARSLLKVSEISDWIEGKSKV